MSNCLWVLSTFLLSENIFVSSCFDSHSDYVVPVIFNLMVGIYSWYSMPLLRIGLICQENRRSNITILTSNNKIILYFTSFTTFRQSNYGQIKIKSNSWISNFKKMSGVMSTDNKGVLFPKTNRSMYLGRISNTRHT